MVVSTDEGKSFQYRGFVDMHDIEGGAATATFDEHIYVEHNDGRLVCYMRVHKGIAVSTSRDKGFSWTKPVLSTIKGPDSRFFIRRLQSGNLLLVNNDSDTKRAKMTAWLSKDDGKSWPYALTLDPVDHDVAYPDGKQAPDGSRDTLSHGERKRSQIAVALWKQPELLALDEPTNHIDAAARRLLIDSLRQFRGVGLLADRRESSPSCG